jgi:hypothetical protein
LAPEAPVRVAQIKATRLSSGQFREKKTKKSNLRYSDCFFVGAGHATTGRPDAVTLKNDAARVA